MVNNIFISLYEECEKKKKKMCKTKIAIPEINGSLGPTLRYLEIWAFLPRPC